MMFGNMVVSMNGSKSVDLLMLSLWCETRRVPLKVNFPQIFYMYYFIANNIEEFQDKSSFC